MAWVVYGVYLTGVVMNGMAAIVSAIPSTTGFNDSPFPSVILPSFLRGNLDTVWASWSAYPWLWGALMMVSLGALAPILLVELARRRDERGF